MKRFVERWLSGREEVQDAVEPCIESGRRIYCIGDIHGRADLLRELHAMIENDAVLFDGEKTVVYLGDCIDRGMDSKEVLDELLESPLPGFESIHLMGNHEQTMLEFLQYPDEAAAWLSWGGRETLGSYGITLRSNFERVDVSAIRDELESRLPARHLEFLEKMTIMYQAGDYLFVHAGIRPDVPLQEQSNEDLLWIRNDFIESQARHEYVVVHGHTISDDVVIRPNRIGIDTGAFRTGILTCLVLEGDSRRLLQTGVRG